MLLSFSRIFIHQILLPFLWKDFFSVEYHAFTSSPHTLAHMYEKHWRKNSKLYTFLHLRHHKIINSAQVQGIGSNRWSKAANSWDNLAQMRTRVKLSIAGKSGKPTAPETAEISLSTAKPSRHTLQEINFTYLKEWNISRDTNYTEIISSWKNLQLIILIQNKDGHEFFKWQHLKLGKTKLLWFLHPKVAKFS